MTLSTQFMTMLAMVGMGSIFGASLDTYNRFLKRSTRKQFIVFLNDILFWLLQGLAIFYVLFIVNEGELRFYIFIALFCGFAAYQSLLKRGYLKALEMAISTVVSIWNFLVKLFQLLIYRPLLGLFSLILSTVFMIGRGLFALSKFLGKMLLWMGIILLKPIRLIMLLFWKLLPKKIKKTVEKIYNRLAGFFRGIKNYLFKVINYWGKRNK